MSDTLQDTPAPRKGQRRDRTLLGAVLGAAVGVVVVALLQQTAIAPPERVVVFVCLGLGIAAGAATLTARLRSARFAVAGVLAVLTVAHGLAGLGAWRAPGYIDGGCTAFAQTDSGVVYPASTSAALPFVIDPASELRWAVSTPSKFTEPRVSLAVSIGGVDVPILTTLGEPGEGRDRWSGTEDVPTQLEDVRESTGLPLRGVVHLTASVAAPEGECTLSIFVAVRPDGVFSGPVLTALWTVLAGLLTAVGVLAVRGRRVGSGPAARPPSEG